MFRTEKPLDNPINWSFRVGRLFAIDIRIHIAFVFCAVILLWMEMPEPGSGVATVWSRVLVNAFGTYAMLFLIVLLHEFGHCFGARYMGGDADEILLWPLGGLAYTSPPHNPTAHMITTVAGPSVNVFLCMICTVALILWTGSLGGVPWNPLHPTWPVDPSIIPTEGQQWLMRFFGISYFILLINLLPIFPFDGGRIVQAWLWPKKGYTQSMQIATGTGMVGAIAIGLIGLFTDQSWLLLMIAVFGYMTCYQTRRMLREQGEFGLGEFGYDFSQGYTSLNGDKPDQTRKPGYFARRRARKLALKVQRERRQDEEHEAQVERILQKISDSGMASLSTPERRILEAETERRRLVSDDS
ncbi:MAG: hypothetical protein IID33_06395 [Planctomycetes bacterium]|nr:hypothetical protein [Planctomycetota bacterium]